MANPINCEIINENVGGEATIAAMPEYSRQEIGRKTLNFARSIMRNPEYRRLVEEKLAQKRAGGQMDT